jgi:hypothetical protein
MKYRVLRDGVSQREGAGFVERKEGDVIELSQEAAEHLLAEKYVEEDSKPMPRAKTQKDGVTP